MLSSKLSRKISIIQKRQAFITCVSIQWRVAKMKKVKKKRKKVKKEAIMTTFNFSNGCTTPSLISYTPKLSKIKSCFKAIIEI